MSFADETRDALPRPIAERPILAAVLAVTLLSLTIRLVGLGARTAHFDEGRVAYWALRYGESGAYEYRYITHGPFLHLVNGTVFETIGANDVTARLVVALVGGLLPLSALLFRSWLRPPELIGMAALLAFDPTMVYYSRFMRNDVLVAAFAFVALGFVLLAVRRRRLGYLYAGAFSLALAFTTKENALVYVLCWLGAGTLVLGHVAVRRWRADQLRASVDDRLAWLRGGTWQPGAKRWGGHTLAAAVLFLSVIVFFYAPRGSAATTVGFWDAFTQPSAFPSMLRGALLDRFPQTVDGWTGMTTGDDDMVDSYRTAIENMTDTLLYGSGAVVALGVAGFVHELFVEDRPRLLVLAASYWAFASVLGYPLAASVQRPAWLVVHVVVPLSIPAAAALGVLARWASEAMADDDLVSVALCVVIVLTAFVGMGVVVADTSYQNPHSHDNVMVQFAQPESDMRATLDTMERVAPEHDGTDVVYYGEDYHMTDESAADQPPVPAAQSGWFDRLPLPWYTAAYGADVSSADDPESLAAELDDRPPIVVVDAWEIETAERQLDGYVFYEYELRESGSSPIVVYVDEAYVDE